MSRRKFTTLNIKHFHKAMFRPAIQFGAMKCDVRAKRETSLEW